MDFTNEESLSDEQLRIRTDALLRSAENISAQLREQTERLAEAIDVFDREILTPLRSKGHPQ